MEFRETPAEASFRRDVRRFVAESLPREFSTPAVQDRINQEGGSAADEPLLSRWRAALGDRGWLAPQWPKEYGGAGMTVGEQFIFNEEMALARTPDVGAAGLERIGPILIMYGTEEQKREHLPRITSGEVRWCQGYSEPGAGSDLASLQTRAVRDGDDFIINGQKIWTSQAHRSQWMFMLARTDPDAPKHRGITMLLMDMRAPGITVRPLINVLGEHGFNEVFFDNVRVPARNIVGEENRGWYIGATLLDFERSLIRSVIGLRQDVEALIAYARDPQTPGTASGRPTVRVELGERLIEAEIARLFSHRIIGLQKQGRVPNYEASINKLFLSETDQRIAQTGMKLIGAYGNLYRDPKWAPLRGRFARHYLRSPAISIAGGTSEIQRNVIATRGLGLPRG